MIMALRARDLTIREYVNIVSPYVILLVLGAVGRGTYPDTWRLHKILHSFFDACMIAGIMAILIELFSANRLIQHVADFLAGKLIGLGLPNKLQQEINKIARTDLVVHNYFQTYSIAKRNDEKFTVDVTVSFELKNYAQASVDWVPSIQSQILYHPEFLHLEYGLADNSQILSYDHETLINKVAIEPGSHAKIVKGLKEIKIPPLAQDPNAHCKVTWKYRLVHPEEFTDITAFGKTTIGATIRIDAIPEGYIFYASQDPSTKHSPDGITWQYDNVFFRKQYINVWCFKKET
jgi:hypothetical protein